MTTSFTHQMTCTRCQADTPAGIHLCHACTTTLEDILDRAPEALTNVQTTVARMDRIGHGRGASGNRAEAVNVSALDEKIDLTEKIQAWVNLVRDIEGRNGTEEVTPIACLRANVHRIRTHDWAGDMLDELEDAVRTVERVTDRPIERRLYGTCGTPMADGTACMAILSAEAGTELLRCRDCGARYSVAYLEEMIRDQVRGQPMAAADCRQWILDHVGVRVQSKDMRNWTYRRLLPYVLDLVPNDSTEHRPTGRAHRMHYPGDVLNLHATIRERRRSVA